MAAPRLDIVEQDARLALLTSDIRHSGARDFRRKFYCPILHVEERIELCKGHVLPQAIGGKDWVVQRKDVDNFFGSFANAGFSHGVRLQNREFDAAVNYVLDKGLAGRANLSIQNEEGIKRRIRPIERTGTQLKFVASETASFDFTKPVSISFGLDVRYDALLSCVHSLHLGLFKERGYVYAACRTGEFNSSLLREVYRAFSPCSDRRRKEPELLGEICQPYQNMVRPVLLSDSIYPRLVENPFRWFFVAWNESTGMPFATIHFLQMDNECVAVMSYANLDESAGALISSNVPISFKTTLGHVAKVGVEVGPLRDDTQRMIWPCGDSKSSQIPCPIEIAAEEFVKWWNAD